MDDKFLAIVVGAGLRAARVVDFLAASSASAEPLVTFAPTTGPNSISKAILKWVTEEKIASAFNDPGKPRQTA